LGLWPHRRQIARRKHRRDAPCRQDDRAHHLPRRPSQSAKTRPAAHRPDLARNLAGEHDARALYIEARDHCEKVSDYVTKALFEELITDEEGHIDFLETQIDLFDRLGEANYGLLQAKPANEAE
jgi:hypothetical protein